MTTHRIGHEAIHTYWDNGLAPRLTIAPGDTVIFETLEPSRGRVARDFAATPLPDVAPDLAAIIAADALPEVPTPMSGHALTGPVFIAGAEPGMHPTPPPRHGGGNMDIRQLTAGTVLSLPVLVPGALFSTGDAHAAQGDGEVSGTAIECNATVTLRFDLRKGRTIPTPQFRTAGPLRPRSDAGPWFAATGHDTDPRAAARAALLGVLDHLVAEHGLTPARAGILASACVDLRISQVVNAGTWTVTALLPLSVFGGSKV